MVSYVSVPAIRDALDTNRRLTYTGVFNMVFAYGGAMIFPEIIR